MGDDRADSPLKLTDVVLHALGDEFYALFSELDTAVGDTALEDLAAKLQVGAIECVASSRSGYAS